MKSPLIEITSANGTVTVVIRCDSSVTTLNFSPDEAMRLGVRLSAASENARPADNIAVAMPRVGRG